MEIYFHIHLKCKNKCRYSVPPSVNPLQIKLASVTEIMSVEPLLIALTCTIIPNDKVHLKQHSRYLQSANSYSISMIYASEVSWGLSNGETTSLMLPDAFFTSTWLLISSAKCTINRFLVSMQYLITVLHSGKTM